MRVSLPVDVPVRTPRRVPFFVLVFSVLKLLSVGVLFVYE
jgi:hypothetical protein